MDPNPRSELPRETPSTEAEWFLQTLRVGEIVLRTTVVAAGEPKRPKIRRKSTTTNPKKRRRFLGFRLGPFFVVLMDFFFGGGVEGDESFDSQQFLCVRIFCWQEMGIPEPET